jgi:6-phosphogluconolactonase (cycloisomerase 2 family)
VLDPTEQYLIFPDLGGNRVYVYCIDPKTSILEEHAPLSFKSKYGPRHAVFWVKEYVTFMFVVHEIANRITSYKVTYLPSGGLNFTEVDDVSTFGNTPPPETAVPAPAAAEIVKVCS